MQHLLINMTIVRNNDSAYMGKCNQTVSNFRRLVNEAGIYLGRRCSWIKMGIGMQLRRAFRLEVVSVPATEGLPILLSQIDAKLRLTDNEEWPEEHRDSLQG